MSKSTLLHNGKQYFLDSVKTYPQFKQRLTLLRQVHPNLKYKFKMIKKDKQTLFMLYVRKWGTR